MRSDRRRITMNNQTTYTPRTLIETVRDKVRACQNCELRTSCREPVPMMESRLLKGSERRFAVIGEAPGRMEDRKGQPFVGPAGRYLRRKLSDANLDPGRGYYLNAVSCWPQGTPTDAHILACKQNLIDQWEVMDTAYVLACGQTAIRAILPHATNHTRNKVMKIHGKYVMPVYHPSYVLFHNPNAEPAFQKSLYMFWALVNGLVEPVGVTCVYCRKPTQDERKFACSPHMAWWRKDRDWKMPRPPQMSLEM
jgi:DNA polymerase